MSDHIPFEIQSEILKRLPVRSLIQFRSVSKQWKSFIDNPKFIKNYHINHTNPQHHLFVCYELDNNVQTYTSIVDDNTFPQHKFPLTPPQSLSLIRDKFPLCSAIDGLLCFYGLYGGDPYLRTRMAVIWNPTLRKSVSVVIPDPKMGYNVVGFGVCPNTSDLMLVKISVDRISSMWEVHVFTLSTRVWKTVYTGAPFISYDLMWVQVFVDGVIYFLADDDYYLVDYGIRSKTVISFDLKSEEFGQVCLPERLVHTLCLDVVKVNESLGLLDYYDEGDMTVCGVWTRKDGANKPFTKIYTVRFEEGMWLLNRVLGFRNNGEALMDVVDDDTHEESRIEVYEPLSGHTHGIGINGEPCTFSARSYMETLLLLDQSDSIIH